MGSKLTHHACSIAIVGVGQVGGAVAFGLILSSLASEILLVDTDATKRNGQVRDLADAAYAHGGGTRVRAATHHEAGQCDIVVITAGSKQIIGQTSIENMYHSVSIIRNVIDAMSPLRSDSIIIVVSNPVDLLASLAAEISRLPTHQVLGSGTFLDSIRLRGLVADKLNIRTDLVRIDVVGVRGEPQVPEWSAARIDGIPMDDTLQPNTSLNRTELEKECRMRSQEIIRAKGSTPFGISSVVCKVCESIIHDKRNVLPISHFQAKFGCYFTLPAIVGREGVVRTVSPLADGDLEGIADSAVKLRSVVDQVRRNS